MVYINFEDILKLFKTCKYGDSIIIDWQRFKSNMDSHVQDLVNVENHKQDVGDAKYHGDGRYVLPYSGSGIHFEVSKEDSYYVARIFSGPRWIPDFRTERTILYHTDKNYLINMMIKQIQYYRDLYYKEKNIMFDNNLINMKKCLREDWQV